MSGGNPIFLYLCANSLSKNASILYTYNAGGEKLSCRKVMSAMPPDNGSLSSKWLINNVE